MSLFYKVSDKKLLKDRNDLFQAVGVTSLQNNNFKSAPFKTSWNGEYNSSIQGYIYDFGRISSKGCLEYINVYIAKGDVYIKIHLNIFNLTPKSVTINDLKYFEGIKFGIPPNSETKMRLRSDDYKLPPLFYIMFLPEHKIGSYYTKSGYEVELAKLNRLIKLDMENIDGFVKRWHELHKPNVTDWEGN